MTKISSVFEFRQPGKGLRMHLVDDKNNKPGEGRLGIFHEKQAACRR